MDAYCDSVAVAYANGNNGQKPTASIPTKLTLVRQSIAENFYSLLSEKPQKV